MLPAPQGLAAPCIPAQQLRDQGPCEEHLECSNAFARLRRPCGDSARHMKSFAVNFRHTFHGNVILASFDQQWLRSYLEDSLLPPLTTRPCLGALCLAEQAPCLPRPAGNRIGARTIRQPNPASRDLLDFALLRFFAEATGASRSRVAFQGDSQLRLGRVGRSVLTRYLPLADCLQRANLAACCSDASTWREKQGPCLDGQVWATLKCHRDLFCTLVGAPVTGASEVA